MPIRLTLPIQDPVLIFGLCMAVILVAPILFRRIRVPGIMGLIVAGTLMGPNALNLLDRSETIVLLGTVGLLYIMFLAGLDINLNQFHRYRRRSVVFGVLTFVVPQVLGTAIFLLLGFPWPASILIASMFASHTLVAYPVARRLGIHRNPAVTTAVGGTILTDTAALLVLVVVARAVQGELSPAFWLTLGGLFIGYLAVVLLLLPRVARWFFRNIQDGAPAEFAFVLATVFLCSWGARAIGTEPIIGAFLAGLTLNRLVPESGPLMGRLQFFGDAFIIPFFLLYIGMLVDPAILFSGSGAWVVMGAMLATVTTTKWIAAWITARIFGYSREQGGVIFGLSLAQAAATLAATLVGYNLNIIGDDVLNGVILMIFATCILAPWLVERNGRSVALQQAEAPLDPSDAPERILIPMARPASAEGLLDLAFAIRGTDGEPIYPLFVVPHGAPRLVADGEAMLGHAVRYAAAAEVPLVPITRVDPSIASAVSRAVQEERIATIVTGWGGEPSTEQRIFGSVTDQILEQTGAGVLVCRLTRPFNVHEAAVLAIPPGGAAEPRFDEAVRLAKRAAAAVGRPLRLFAWGSQVAAVRDRVDAVPPRLPLLPEESGDWEGALDRLAEAVADDELLILLSARQGSVSWRGELRDLPGDLARRRPDLSIVVLYPPEEVLEEETDAPSARGTASSAGR